MNENQNQNQVDIGDIIVERHGHGCAYFYVMGISRWTGYRINHWAREGTALTVTRYDVLNGTQISEIILNNDHKIIKKDNLDYDFHDDCLRGTVREPG